MKSRSRLSRRVEKQSKKTFYLSVLGIIVVVFLLIKFAIPLLANLSLMLSGNKNTPEAKEKTKSYVAAPVLHTLPNATNSAQMPISGVASSQTVKLYINDEKVDETQVRNGTFTFESVKLHNGENIIKAKAVAKDDSVSDFSQLINITVTSKAPSLSLEFPTDGQSYSKDDNTAQIKGKTDAGVKVTINDLWAIVDENGGFRYTLPLKNGENQIKIVATDDAGNKTEMTRKFTYSQ